MNVKELMKNIEKQNKLRKELKQDELLVCFDFPLVGIYEFKTLFDLYEFINEIYTSEYIEEFTTASVEVGNEIIANVKSDAIYISII